MAHLRTRLAALAAATLLVVAVLATMFSARFALLRDAAPARAPEAAALLGESAPAARLVGCWRVTSTLAMDPVQTDPRIVRTNGDTLWLALTPTGVQAEVVRSDDLLRGLARTTAGASAPITARLERCTP